MILWFYTNCLATVSYVNVRRQFDRKVFDVFLSPLQQHSYLMAHLHLPVKKNVQK